MSDESQPQLIRVFLSSPGDVADERALARRLLKDELPYDPFLRGKVVFDVVSWDDPDAPTPMPAPLRPQEAVNRFGPKPSECDVVVVVLWSRMGTHLDLEVFSKPDGTPYRSGTEWEFEDARSAHEATGRPEILVYQRTEPPRISVPDPDDPAVAKALEQRRLVNHFFARFRNPDGSSRGSLAAYPKPTAFKERLASDLKHLLHDRCLSVPWGASGPAPAVASGPGAPGQDTYAGPPYPGLRPFKGEEAPIFFGRGREVDALVARLRDPTQRFLAVVGASGTGKSSLVRAGLLPRLADGAIEGSRHWPVLAFAPGAVSDDPFAALAVELARVLPPMARARRPADIARSLAEAPHRLAEDARAMLAGRPDDAALVLFVDQLEELFTLCAEGHRRGFLELLAGAADHSRFRVLATLRADFLPQCAAEAAVAALLQTGTYVLGAPGRTALADMIRKPAERVGLHLEEDLADEILREAGGDPGEALPLVAFCLEELYRRTAPVHRLTLHAYRAVGGLLGAVGRRAGELLDELRTIGGADLDTALQKLFCALVRVDATGKVARQRAFRDALMTAPAPMPELVETMVTGRLLLAKDAGGQAVVTLAHEALLQAWPALHEWLQRNRARMQRMHRLLLSLQASELADRRYAVKALGSLGHEEAGAVIPLLAAALDSDPDPGTREASVIALARIWPSAKAVPALAKALERDIDARVRSEAAKALGELGGTAAAAEAVLALSAALGDAEPDVRVASAKALERLGPAAVPALAAALADAKPDVRVAAAKALERIGPAAVPALAAALGEARTDVRILAIETLDDIGAEAAKAAPALAAAFRDTEPYVRAIAAEIFRRIGPAAADAAPVLTAALRDARGDVRRRAAKALGQIGPSAAEALSALAAAAGDAEPDVCRAAADALERIRPASARRHGCKG